MQQEILRKGFQEGSSPALTSNSWCFLKQQLVQMYRQWYWDSLTRQWDDNCKTNCFERPGWKQTWCGIGLTWVLHARLSYIFLWMHFSTFLLNTFTPLASPHQSSITNHHSIITPPPSIILLVFVWTWQFYPTTIAPLFGKYMKIWWYTSNCLVVSIHDKNSVNQNPHPRYGQNVLDTSNQIHTDTFTLLLVEYGQLMSNYFISPLFRGKSKRPSGNKYGQLELSLYLWRINVYHLEI